METVPPHNYNYVYAFTVLIHNVLVIRTAYVHWNTEICVRLSSYGPQVYNT